MRVLLLALALLAGFASAAPADVFDGYDCPQQPTTTTETQTPAPQPGA